LTGGKCSRARSQSQSVQQNVDGFLATQNAGSIG
jgi:hypothetical protein